MAGLETLGAVGSIISIAGLVGRIAQAVIVLHGIVQDVKNAPTEVALIISELTVLEGILRDIITVETSESLLLPGTTLHSLELLSARIDELEVWINQNNSQRNLLERPSFRKRMKYPLCKPSLEFLLQNLQRAKMQLLLCRQQSLETLITKKSIEQIKLLKVLSTKMAHLELQSSNMTQLISHLQYALDLDHKIIVGIDKATAKFIPKIEMSTSTETLSLNMEERDSTSSEEERVAWSEQVTTVPKISLTMGMAQDTHVYQDTRETAFEMCQRLASGNTTASDPMQWQDKLAPKHQQPRFLQRKSTQHFRCATWLGYLSITIEPTIYVNSDVTSSILMAILPASWLLDIGVILRAGKMFSQYSKPRFSLTLSFFTQICCSDPISVAFQAQKLDEMQLQLSIRGLSPSEVMIEGQGLLANLLADAHDNLMGYFDGKGYAATECPFPTTEPLGQRLLQPSVNGSVEYNETGTAIQHTDFLFHDPSGWSPISVMADFAIALLGKVVTNAITKKANNSVEKLLLIMVF